MTLDKNKLIITDPKICHGKPVFKGTRIMVWQVLEMLEAGKNNREIAKAFPSLPKGSIEAALNYATQKVKSTSYVPVSLSA